MTRTSKQRYLYLGSILTAVLPIIVALSLAVRHHFDTRALAAVLASFAGVAITMAVGRARQRPFPTLLALAGAATLAGIVVSIGVTTRFAVPPTGGAPLGTPLHLLFALLWAVSHVLDTISRPEARAAA